MNLIGFCDIITVFDVFWKTHKHQNHMSPTLGSLMPVYTEIATSPLFACSQKEAHDQQQKMWPKQAKRSIISSTADWFLVQGCYQWTAEHVKQLLQLQRLVNRHIHQRNVQSTHDPGSVLAPVVFGTSKIEGFQQNLCSSLRFCYGNHSF